MKELLILLDLHFRLQLPLDLQLLIQLVLPLLEGDAAAAVCVLHPHTPVVDLLQEVAWTHLVPDPQYASPVEAEDVVKDIRVPVEEVLIVGHSVVVAQAQLQVVVRVCGQAPYSGRGILSCCLVSYLVDLPPYIDVDHVVLLGREKLLWGSVLLFVLILGINVIDVPGQLRHRGP